MAMKRQMVLPNLLTASSLCCGLFVIFKMNMIQPGTAVFEQVQYCVKILLVASVLDVLDGALARVMKVESEFGGFFDSMADSVSFGIAPSVVVLKTLSVLPGTFLAWFLTAGAITYSVGGVLRLVRYSTTPPSTDPEMKGTFTGLPITAGAMAVVSPTLFLMSDTWQELCPTSDFVRSLVGIGAFFFLAYLMVSRWRFISLKSINVRVANLRLIIGVASLSSVILLLALNNFSIALFLVSWIYVLGAWILACIRLAQGKRQAALDEEKEEQSL
jgi:CDP-diacylglycerol--serine O-phosphatidyltransferase